ncbi:hypothetical protein G8759_10110 [Spirosoma aureum]|uniref:Uncharacterized protein n=1 Tax=Spirosoma aureum TaxID=2692134 RepID=A0A6G9AKF4_9BACT|nr:hypothetical protein [Spirosoma aureum]QIP12952.1 hypothetical protein G8759_10110 [Spirosoma aureum]
MASHALDQRLFDQTVGAFGDGTATSPADGVQLINGWLKVIEGNISAEIIEGKLKELRSELQFTNPDADRIRALLFSLADHTSQVAQGSNIQDQTSGKLENVATSLRKLAGQL